MADPMTPEELAAIDARLVKAAPRTWGHSMACRYPEGCTCDASEHNAAVAYANAARDDLHRLRAEVDRLRAQVAHLQTVEFDASLARLDGLLAEVAAEPAPDWRAALEAAGLVRGADDAWSSAWRRGGVGEPVVWGWQGPSDGQWWSLGSSQPHPTEEAAARAWLARQEARRG